MKVWGTESQQDHNFFQALVCNSPYSHLGHFFCAQVHAQRETALSVCWSPNLYYKLRFPIFIRDPSCKKGHSCRGLKTQHPANNWLHKLNSLRSLVNKIKYLNGEAEMTHNKAITSSNICSLLVHICLCLPNLEECP